jgi:Fe-S cluster assembly iron-binding protein IscA
MENEMGRFSVISMTDAAAARVREIVASRDGAQGVRVGIKKAAARAWNTRSTW